MTAPNEWYLLLTGSDELLEKGGKVSVALQGAHDYDSATAAAQNFMSAFTPESLVAWFAGKIGMAVNPTEVISYNVGCTDES
jgi:hypothetical protein